MRKHVFRNIDDCGRGPKGMYGVEDVILALVMNRTRLRPQKGRGGRRREEIANRILCYSKLFAGEEAYLCPPQGQLVDPAIPRARPRDTIIMGGERGKGGRPSICAPQFCRELHLLDSAFRFPAAETRRRRERIPARRPPSEKWARRDCKHLGSLQFGRERRERKKEERWLIMIAFRRREGTTPQFQRPGHSVKREKGK